MNIMNQDQQSLEKILQDVVQHSMEFLNGLGIRNVSAKDTQIDKQPLNPLGIGAAATLDYFKQHYAERMSTSAGPRYLGFVTGGSTPAAIVGDWLVSVYDQNVSGSQDSIASALEHETIDLLKELFHLEADYTGAFVSGATMANFVGLAQARQWLAKQYGINPSLEGLYHLPPIKIFSATPHSSIYKAVSMLGIGKNAIQQVPCQQNREAIEIAALQQLLEQNQNEPCIVVANAGTVNTVDFDDLLAIAQLKKRYHFWLHIDAAFGGFAACSPQYRELVNGINVADSITIDAHKWLNVPYDAAMQFTRHQSIQVEVFQNNAAYLGGTIENPEFFDLTPENSRRFRALPAWFTLKAYGKSGYQQLIEQNVELAQKLGEKIQHSEAFTLLSPVRLNVVCFTLNQEELTTQTIHQFLQCLKAQGSVFMTPTVYHGIPAIRAAFSNWRTEEKDVDTIWEALQTTFQTIQTQV